MYVCEFFYSYNYTHVFYCINDTNFECIILALPKI